MKKKMKQLKIAAALAVAFVAGAAAMFVLMGRGKTAEAVAERHAVKKSDSTGSARKAAASTRKKPIPEVAAAKPRPEGAEDVRMASKEQPAEKPEADAVEQKSDKDAKDDNPFPRYLDMFKNDPDALAAEFLKEADKDRASQRKMRDEAVANLKLNAEQAAFFEKALDDLVAEITQQNREWADLVASGKLNEETADGAIWSSNPLLAQRMVAAREAAVRETGEKLYENLVLDGVSDAEEQRVLRGVVYRTSFSYECYVPDLAVYDKVYKNMGFGTGIFSWCIRQSRK